VSVRLRRLLWVGGWPARAILLALVRLYRLTLGQVVGGRCRFHPSCSAYAEQAISQVGAVRGVALTAWRVIRCSPLSSGGVDYPPKRPVYDNPIQPVEVGSGSERGRGAPTTERVPA
jgi:putative membrane protein insertion efficiency factor